MWQRIGCTESTLRLALSIVWRSFVLVTLPLIVYIGVFYAHLAMLPKAGPHDSVMTSAFQASLQGGLASITRGQPLHVSHGSQITLRLRLYLLKFNNNLIVILQHIITRPGTLTAGLVGCTLTLMCTRCATPTAVALHINSKSHATVSKTSTTGG